MLEGLREDIRAVRERDPAARSDLEVLLLSAGLHAIWWHRPAHFLYRQRCYLPARMMSQFARFLTGIEIHPGAQIGRGVLIDHGAGVVIGETAQVGDGCTIYQGVTLGGTGKDKGKRHPTLGKNVLVGAGAKILGPFTVGDNSKVAAGAVLLQPLPPGSTAVGVPAKAVRVEGKKVDALDHVHTPDPVFQELAQLRRRIEVLEGQLARQEMQEVETAPAEAGEEVLKEALTP